MRMDQTSDHHVINQINYMYYKFLFLLFAVSSFLNSMFSGFINDL